MKNQSDPFDAKIDDFGRIWDKKRLAITNF